MVKFILFIKSYKSYIISFLFITNSLCSCGGGGTATSNAAATLAGGPISFTTIKNYPSGAGVLTASGVAVAGQPDSNFTVGHRDISSTQTVITGTTNLVNISSNQSGSNYTVLRAGTSSTNKYIIVSTEGTNLNYSGSEYVSASAVTIDGVLGAISAGSKPNGLPTGSHTYQGTAIIVKNNNIPISESGSFAMTIDFSNQTGSIAANTSNYLFNENNIVINNSDGSFSGTTGNIGTIGGTTEASNLKGYFAGTNGSGTHGLAYSSGSQENYAGVFYGTK